MIEHIKQFDPELGADPLLELEVLEYGEIHVAELKKWRAPDEEFSDLHQIVGQDGDTDKDAESLAINQRPFAAGVGMRKAPGIPVSSVASLAP
jgi:hypothetical protein